MALVLSDRHGAVAVLTLNDPDRRNPLSTGMREELIEAVQEVSADPSVGALVLTGAGGAFSSGGDLGSMPPASANDAAQRLARVRLLIELVTRLPIPVIAAVEGPAAGVSAGLVAACDVVVAAEGSRFLFPFTKLGLMPDGGALATVARRTGDATARRIFLLAEPVPAATALAIGLADRTVERGGALKAAVAVAADLATRAPGSTAGIKAYYADGFAELTRALDTEAATQVERYFSAEFTEGKSAFFEGRDPDFSARSAAGQAAG